MILVQLKFGGKVTNCRPQIFRLRNRGIDLLNKILLTCICNIVWRKISIPRCQERHNENNRNGVQRFLIANGYDVAGGATRRLR